MTKGSMTKSFLILIVAGMMMGGLVSAEPKYGPGYKSNWGAKRPQSNGGNYSNAGVIEYFGERPIAFSWVGDQLWIMWEHPPTDGGMFEYPYYEIVPHPVDHGVFEIAIFHLRDWRKYWKWIRAGVPRNWEADWDPIKEDWIKRNP